MDGVELGWSALYFAGGFCGCGWPGSGSCGGTGRGSGFGGAGGSGVGMVAMSNKPGEVPHGSRRHGTQASTARSHRMDRHEKIKLSLERIKVTKKLVAKQEEFIKLAKSIGFEPVHAASTLQRFRAQLSAERAALLRLTRTGRKTVTAPERPYPSARQKAA